MAQKSSKSFALCNLWYNIAYCDLGVYFCKQNAVRLILLRVLLYLNAIY